MSFKPLIIDAGQFKQLPSGQALDVGGWTLPTAGGTDTYFLTANGSGDAVWTTPSFGNSIPANSTVNEVYVGTGAGTAAWTTDLAGLTSLTVDNITINGAVISSDTGAISFSNENLTTTGTVVGSNIPSPTVDDQVLISTTAGIAGWQTAGIDQVLTSSGSGEVTWTNQSALGITETDTLDTVADRGATTDQTLTTGGIATTGTVSAGLLTVDNISINAAIISSDTGAISFSNENLTTTGSLTSNKITSTYSTMYLDGSATAYHGLISEDRTGGVTGTCVIDLPNGFQSTMLGIRISGYNYSSIGAWSISIGGYAFNTTDDTWLNHHANIQGNPPFTSVRLGWNGNTSKACIMLGTTGSSWSYPVIHVAEVIAGFTNETVYQTGWGINWYTDETNFTGQTGYADPVTVSTNQDFPSPTVDDQVLISTATGIAGWQTASNDEVLASNGSGDVAWTSKPFGYLIPSPSASGKALVSTASGTSAWYTTGLFDVLKIEVPSASGAERRFILTADPGSQFAIEAAPWPLTLEANETVYVRTTGNDTTGDGSLTFPFLTLERTVTYLGGLYIGDYTITIDIGEGVFTEAGTLSFMHPFGSQVTFQGVSEQITSQNTNSISASGTSLGFSNLYYYDVTFILPVGKSVSVGDYIAVRAVSGGTLPNALRGCHYVSTWVGGSRTATVRVVYRNGAPKASGTVTCTIELIKTVIAFSNKNGIKLNGTYTGGTWRGLVLQGDYNDTNTSAKYGVWLLNSATMNFGGSEVSGDAVGIVGFQTGMYAQNNAMMFGDYCFVSRCGTRCANAQNGGILNLRYAHLSGANNDGIFCFNGSTCAAQNVSVVAVGNNSVYSYQGSFIDAQNAYIDENNATNAFLADRWSGIDANSSTYSDSISPSTPGNNDGSYVIIA